MILPQDIINRALDAIGAATLIGNFSDGTRAAEAARRVYGPTLRQLLRAAHWAFARKEANLLLLADSTGQTLDPGTGQPISTLVEPGWLYCYAWPNDCVQPRWLPWTNNYPPNIAIPPTPPVPLVVGGTTQPYLPQYPARFLSSTSPNFPAAVGQVDWDNMPELGEGQGLINRRVILTNMYQALLVYTALVTEIELWDALFAEAMVAALGMKLALPVLVSPDVPSKEQMAQRQVAMRAQAQQIAITRTILDQARAASANEIGFPLSVAHSPDWMRARRIGRGWGRDWMYSDGPGYFWCGWDGFAMGDGGVY